MKLRIALLAGTTALLLCHCSSTPEEAAEPPRTLNSTCLILEGEELDPEVTVTFDGHEIGFCCNLCLKQWNEMSYADREKAVRNIR
jgi:hypothetical protein